MKYLRFCFLLLCGFLIGCHEKENDRFVKFIGIDGNIIKEEKFINEEDIIFPSYPDVLGYDFIEWEKNYDGNNLNIKAKYEKKEYLVKIVDGENVLDSFKIKYQDKITYHKTFDKEGYSYIGLDWDFEKEIVSDTTISALFKANEYTVTFYNKDNSVYQTAKVKYDSLVEAIAGPVIEGYDFVNWDFDFDSKIKGDIDIYPIYKKEKLQVRFYNYDNSIFETLSFDYGDEISFPSSNPTKKGAEFVKWNVFEKYVMSSLDIYPEFIDKYYTVKFIGFNGEVLKEEVVQKDGDADEPDAPSIEHYKFIKWSSEDFLEVQDNVEISAIYEEIVYTKYSPWYWIKQYDKKKDSNDIVLSEEEIAKYNEIVCSNYTSTKVVDVLKISEKLTGTYVKNLINNYSIMNKYTVYNATTQKAITSEEKDMILKNRNIESIGSEVIVKYGIVTSFSWMRSYPTNNFANNYSMDMFQETSLNVGEIVAIYHESSDGLWLYVQGYNYNGWVEKKNIGQCAYQEMADFSNAKDKLVVIANYVTIEKQHVRMGQAFPILRNDEGKVVILFPKRNYDGKLILSEIEIILDENYSIGYLPYNIKNLYLQAFKMLGDYYSWGDKVKTGRDCSSTQNSVYSSFGLKLPRNGSNQNNIPTYGSKVNGVTSRFMRENYQVGSLIFSSGHVMMYIGEDENGVSYIFHDTSAGTGQCIVQKLDEYGGSKIIGTLKVYN